MSLTVSSAPRARPHRPVSARSRAELLDLLRSLDPALAPESPAGVGALVLLAGLQMEHNVVKIAHFLGCEPSLVSRCARRLIDNGVWSGGETICAWSAEGGNLRFLWMDVDVGAGKLCRRSDPEGRLQWAPQGQWWKSFEHVRSGEPEFETLYHVPELPDPAPPVVVARGEQPGGVAATRADLFPGAAWL